jgi:hypothetical protein
MTIWWYRIIYRDWNAIKRSMSKAYTLQSSIILLTLSLAGLSLANQPNNPVAITQISNYAPEIRYATIFNIPRPNVIP